MENGKFDYDEADDRVERYIQSPEGQERMQRLLSVLRGDVDKSQLVTDISDPGDGGDMNKLGGWVYLLFASLVCTSALGIVILVSRLGESWGYTVARLTESESSSRLILSILEFSMPLLISLASMRLIYLLLNRKQRFVNLFYSIAVIAVLWPVVDLGLCWAVMPEFMRVEPRAHDAFIFWFFIYVALFGAWIPYVRSSQRLKSIFR